MNQNRNLSKAHHPPDQSESTEKAADGIQGKIEIMGRSAEQCSEEIKKQRKSIHLHLQIKKEEEARVPLPSLTISRGTAAGQ